MNIALLSNINIDPLEKYLKKDFETIYRSGYNQLLHDLLDAKCVLYNQQFDVVFLHLDGDEFLKKYLFEPITLDTVKEEVQTVINDLFSAIDRFAVQRRESVIMLNTIVISPRSITKFLERNSSYSRAIIKEWINYQISLCSQRHSNVLIYDWETITSKYGYDNLYDYKFWYLGRIKLNGLACEVLGREIGNLIAAYRGNIRKVLVLDIDNTLWGGIIGEDGIAGIQLSEEGIGKVYVDFQRAIKSLKRIGIILALCSKNNYDDIKEAFDNHPLMMLKLADFASVRINWSDKVTNLCDIADDLNVGLESFVFIDDNPIERTFVREHLSDVAVPEFPGEVTSLLSWFVDDVVTIYFPKLSITEEDISKTEQYMANKQRKSFGNNLDIDTFIERLDIKLTLHENNHLLVARTAQLTQKTNQFNVTTKRYATSDIETLLNSSNWAVFNLEYEDSFGKEGVIGTAIVRVEQKSAFLDSFLLSCRIIGRKVEFSFIDLIIRAISAKYKNIKTLYAEFRPTRKNTIASCFLDNAGFALIDCDAMGTKQYSKEVIALDR